MKTSKAKTISKPKKPSMAGKESKRKKVAADKSIPSEEDIRKKADEIYHQRTARGEYGTALDDWHKAEEFLKGS
jgi:hypothetical protein